MNERADIKLKRQPTGDYDVGFCRPPAESRWKSGQSGNPRGARKKKRKANANLDIIKLLREELLAEVGATESGKDVKIDLLRFFAKQIIADMIKGTPAHRFKLFKELMGLGVLQPNEANREVDPDAYAAFIKGLAEVTGLVVDEKGQYHEPG
jgi:hypothetical protein